MEIQIKEDMHISKKYLMEKGIFQKSSMSVGCKYMNIITRNQLRLRRLHFEPTSYLRKNKNKESVICSGMKSQQLLKFLVKS